MSFAADTSVSVAKSRSEIETLVQKAGGTKFASMSEEKRAVVLFELADRRVMFELPLPSRDAYAKKKDRWGYTSAQTPEKQSKDWEQACRSKWRALYLTIKAKLVSVEAGVETLEEAFLAHIVVPSSSGAVRFSELAIKAIQQAYTSGLPPMLGSGER